jgi:hypothetical protein
MARQRQRREYRYTSARETSEKLNTGFEPTAIELPKGFKFFQLKREGSVRIDILPYIAGKGNKHADEGFVHYQRMFEVHRGLGISGKESRCCLRQFNKRCPVCEWVDRESRNADPDMVKELRPKLRCLYNVMDTNNREDGIQIWDSAFFNSFGQKLRDKILALEEYDNFYHPQEGFTLQLSVELQSVMGRKYFNVTNIEMIPRKKPYEDSIMEETACLDDCLIELDFDKLKKIFDQTPDEEDDRSTSKEKRTERKTEEDTSNKLDRDTNSSKDISINELEKGQKVLYEDVEWTVDKISKDGKSVILKGEGGRMEKGVPVTKLSTL